MNTSITKQIAELKDYAKAHGLDIRFRNTPNNMGDFCIFIYDKNFRESYTVGFDGSYDNTEELNFEDCLKSAYRWIDKRDNRFIFRDGHWQYGRYHFIVWKNHTGIDSKHYLTIKDADKAGASYVKKGYAVVCFDQTPSGKSALVKIYGDHERHCNEYMIRQIRRFKYRNGEYGTINK